MASAPAWQPEFERQIAQARPILFGIATRIAGPEEAEDIVQTTLMNTWREAHRLSGPQCYAKWATRVVRSVAIDVCRKRRRHPESAFPDGEEELRTTTGRPRDAESAVLARLDEQRAVTVLKGMPETPAKVLFERDGLDMEYPDILDRHGLTFTQLRNMLHRSRQRFKQEFARLGVGIGAVFGLTRRRATSGAHCAKQSGIHAKAVLVKSSIVPKVAGGLVISAIAVVGATIMWPDGPGPAPSDQVPVAAIITEPSESPYTLPSSAPASPSRAASKTAKRSAAPFITTSPAAAPSTAAPSPSAVTQRPTAAPTPKAVVKTIPLPGLATSAVPPSSAATSQAAPPKLGAGAVGDSAPAASQPGHNDIVAVPSCWSAGSSDMTVRWAVTNQTSRVAQIAQHNGTGSAGVIRANATTEWIQTLPKGQTGTWWFKVVDSSGISIGDIRFSGAALAPYPTCS